MKRIIYALCMLYMPLGIYAQNWLLTGNSGTTHGTNFIGTTDARDLVFKASAVERARLLNTAGAWRFGSATNYARIDSTGKLSFGGSGAYQVAGNKYAFQYSGNPNYGLFFNSSGVQYEFRNGSAAPVFFINANTGNAAFDGTLSVGVYTLPATDGVSGQVLKTNGTGSLSWSNDDNSLYTAGSGINIAGNSIINTGDINAADDANLSLSNLSATAINQSLRPAVTNISDIGSVANSWRNIYAQGYYLNGSLSYYSPGTANLFAGGGSLSVTGSYNTSLGIGSLVSLTTGYQNTAIGSNALVFNTSGFYNTAVGYASIQANTNGHWNTALGWSSLANNIAGNYNTAIGANALRDNTTGVANTALGIFSGLLNTTGSNNIFIGINSGKSNTSGYSNVSVGSNALVSNSVGHNLVAIGDSALYSQSVNPTGIYDNTAIGSKALFSNSTGTENTAMGSNALYSNTTGSNNTAIGEHALYSNTTGLDNTANGERALFSNTTGFSNTAFGSAALRLNTTGNSNTAIGMYALSQNNGGGNVAVGFSVLTRNFTGNVNTGIGEIALYSNVSGNYNTANGYSALAGNYSGNKNVAIGALAMPSSRLNSYNVAVGDSTLYSYDDGTFIDYMVAVGSKALAANTTGYYNTGIGGLALKTNISGYGNTALGTLADVSLNNLSNATAIGYNAIATASNQVMLGNTLVTSVKAAGSIVIVSDGRFKKNLKENVPGLAFIKLLHPVTYNYDIHALNEHTSGNPSTNKNAIDNRKNNQEEEAVNNKEKKSYTGFVAQEVEAAADKLQYDFSGVYKPANDKDAYGLSYSDFVVPLVKAVQELSKENDDIKKENDDIKKELNDLKAIVLKIQNSTTLKTSSEQTSLQVVELGMSAKLEQNIPNPFRNTTTIDYYLPKNNSNAAINFYSSAGVLLKSVKLSANGKGTISVKASELPSGTYQYSLITDGKIIDTKKMVQVK